MATSVGGNAVASAVAVVVVTMLVSSAVASDIDVELIDEGYDFQPNIVRDVAPVVSTSAPATVKPPRTTQRKAANPLQRFVSAVVSAHQVAEEKVRLRRATERLGKEKKREKLKEAQEASAMAAQKLQAQKMQAHLRELKVASERKEAQLKKTEAAQSMKDKRREGADIETATKMLATAEKADHVQHSAPLRRGQGAALSSVTKTASVKASEAPPLDGVSDSAGTRTPATASVQLQDTKNIDYDVAAAEASVEHTDDVRLERAAEEFELGQSQDDEPPLKPAPKKHRSEVFLQRDVFESSVAHETLRKYKQEEKHERLLADQALEPANRLRAQEKVILAQAAAEATRKLIKATFPNALMLLDLAPVDASLATQVAQMSTLSAEMTKTITQKSEGVAAAEKKLHPLAAQLSKLRHLQEAVHRRSEAIAQGAAEMLSEEMGESFSDGQHHQTVLLEISSSPNDELADMAKQEEALEGMVSSLGDEQEQLQRGVKARQKKLLAKKNAQLLAAKAVHDQAKERKGKQQKSQVYDSKLLAREARLRMTTSAEVAAEAHLAAALEEKRRHDRERQKQTSVQPVTQLTAEQQTREEYKRMYVQNLKQQAVQVQVDLHNKLRRVRDSDEQHLQEALLTIKDKKNALLHEISEANSLRESLEEDQELGESMENTQPAKTVKKMVAAGHQIADVERETIAQARVLRSQLQDLQGYNNGVAKLAHDQLKTYDMSVTNNADAKLLAAAGSGSMKLRLQLDKLAQLNKHAAKIEKAVGAMQSLVETASSAQTVAQNKLDHVSLQLDRMQQHVKHQESGYTLKKSFKKAPEAELGETQESTTKVSFQAPLVDKTVRHQNIGESSRADPKSKMPIQAQMDWEQQMLIGARSQVEQIKLDTPKLLQKQQEVDNKELTKVLQAAKGDLAQVAHRFEDTAGSISSTIKDGQTLGEAIRDEQDSADGYQRDLVFLKRQVALADTDAQKASNAISMALSQINSLVK